MSQSRKLVALVRRRGGKVQRGRPWRLCLEDRGAAGGHVLADQPDVAAGRAAVRDLEVGCGPGVDHLAPLLAISPARRPRQDTVLIVDGTLVSTWDRTIAASGKNYRYSTNQQVVIDANSRLVVAFGLPLPGKRNDCRAFRVAVRPAAKPKKLKARTPRRSQAPHRPAQPAPGARTGDMRELCQAARGVTSPAVAALCHQTYG